jgi:anti-sigma B factor antagonist
MAVLNFDIKSVSLPSGEEAKAVLLTGSIDASTNQQFESRLTDILTSGTRHVLLVLTNVKYINSTGLGTIVKCVDAFREKQGDIKLVGVPTKVIALFEMLGLLALFETHDTVETAVASFSKGAVAAAPATPAVKFPIQIQHPVTGMGLNVSQPGRFKDPRSGDYFSVEPDGTVQFYATAKVRMLELRIPCDIAFAASVSGLASTLANKVGLPASVTGSAERAIDEVASSIASLCQDPSETCTVLVVADHEKLSIGFVAHGNSLNLPTDAPVLKVLAGLMDEVKHQVLPTRGFILTLVKKK